MAFRTGATMLASNIFVSHGTIGAVTRILYEEGRKDGSGAVDYRRFADQPLGMAMRKTAEIGQVKTRPMGYGSPLRKLIGGVHHGGKRCAKQATMVRIRYGISRLDFRQIYPNTNFHNIRSNRELGFRAGGILRSECRSDGEYHDIVRMALFAGSMDAQDDSYRRVVVAKMIRLFVDVSGLPDSACFTLGSSPRMLDQAVGARPASLACQSTGGHPARRARGGHSRCALIGPEKMDGWASWS